MPVLAQGSSFSAIGTQVNRGIKNRLLTHPNAIFNDRIDCAPDRAVRTDGSLDFNFSPSNRNCAGSSIRLLHQRQLRSREWERETLLREPDFLVNNMEISKVGAIQYGIREERSDY